MDGIRAGYMGLEAWRGRSVVRFGVRPWRPRVMGGDTPSFWSSSGGLHSLVPSEEFRTLVSLPTRLGAQADRLHRHGPCSGTGGCQKAAVDDLMKLA